VNKIVIWDWNGTLLNDVEINCQIINSILKKHGLKQIDLKTYRRYFRLPIIEMYYDLGFTFEKESFSDLTIEYNELYRINFEKINLFDGCKDILKTLKKRNIKQYIISAMNEKELLNHVKQKGIYEFFEKVIGLEDYLAISKKEKAVEFAKTLDRKDEIFFIGDMDHDYEVSKAINAKCILYTNGHQDIEYFLNKKIKNSNKFDNDLVLIDNLKEVVHLI